MYNRLSTINLYKTLSTVTIIYLVVMISNYKCSREIRVSIVGVWNYFWIKLMLLMGEVMTSLWNIQSFLEYIEIECWLISHLMKQSNGIRIMCNIQYTLEFQYTTLLGTLSCCIHDRISYFIKGNTNYKIRYTLISTLFWDFFCNDLYKVLGSSNDIHQVSCTGFL